MARFDYPLSLSSTLRQQNAEEAFTVDWSSGFLFFCSSIFIGLPSFRSNNTSL